MASDVAKQHNEQQRSKGIVGFCSVQYGLARHQSLVAQLLEHPTGVRKVMGSIPVGDSRLFVPFSRQNEHSIFPMFESLFRWLFSDIIVKANTVRDGIDNLSKKVHIVGNVILSFPKHFQRQHKPDSSIKHKLKL